MTRRLLAVPIVLGWVLALLVAGRARADQAADQRVAGSCWPGSPGTDPRLCPPDDPNFPDRWEFLSRIPDEIDRTKVHPGELELGSIGFSLDTAWQHTIGRDDVVIAVLDSGIRWGNRDLVNKLYLNPGELPIPQGATVHDGNGDGVFDIRDYLGDSRVSDRNGNGRIDPGDLILVFTDCEDDDGNGYPDDISGYDFFAETHCGFAGGDNDPLDATDFGHGTGIASTAAAETNNGIANAGVCPRCRVLPVRVGDSFVVDANRFARGVVYAVNAGATVIASALGSYNNTPAARRAVDYAYEHGVPVIASAADEFSYHHNFPSVYNHALYVNAIRFDHATDYRKASTFWGVNPCTNFGARVWITVPATSCSSGATSRLAGVVGLLESMARDAGLGHLHAEEIYQILRMTADDLDNSVPDWGRIRYPARPGFDQLYGYGRLNARRAVLAVKAGRIPPIVDLRNPEWFSIVSPDAPSLLPVTATIRLPRAGGASYVLEYALGVEPADKDYRRIASGRLTGDKEGTIGMLNFKELPVPRGAPPENREDRDNYSVTLRLRVTDDHGLRSEARRSFFVFHDSTWKGSEPMHLGASGEASPLVVDLDDDGRDEIVVPTAGGVVKIIRWRVGGAETLRILLDRGPPVGPSSAAAWPGGDELRRETVIRGAAVGDLTGNGRLSIVVASREGKVYAFSPRGERLAGFPVSTRTPAGDKAGPGTVIENGILSRPVLADLDGRPGQEIVVTSLDGRVHVWNGSGTLVDGFPVSVAAAGGSGRNASKLVSSPAVGDLDGDGLAEIVFGANGLREGLAAAYAIRSQGNRHPGGAFVPGWDPLELPALRALLPTLADGIQMTPILYDVDGDGDVEALLYAATGDTIVLADHAPAGPPRIVAEYSMLPGAASKLAGMSFLGGTGSALLADTDRDGEPELYAPLLPLRILTLRSKPAIPLDAPLALGGWNVRPAGREEARIPMLPDYPRRMEDLMLFARPEAADVDGDGIDEVLMGSGGYLLHAFRRGGGEPEGFPKFTGGWIFSAPAVGDLDGDGRPELVSATREGYLFIWQLGPRKAARMTGAKTRSAR